MRDRPEHASVAGPLLVWLVLNVTSIALGAARVPWSAHFPQPAESIALAQLAFVQFASVSLLAPFLLRDVLACLAVIASAAPMLELAGVLSATPAARPIACWTLLVGWVTLLRAAISIVPLCGQLVVVAIASLLTLGGAAYAYLAVEFQGKSTVFAGPLVAGMRAASRDDAIALAWWWAAGTALAGAVAILLHRFAKFPRNHADPP